MEGESAHKIVFREVRDIGRIISVIDLDSHVLLSFKEVVNGDALHPLGVQVVSDDFSLAHSLPETSRIHENDQEGVG